ncbi:hypothetical protein ACEZDB_21030 [Streptacidiphilus sp. N1-3]|uniref:PBP domain-containing protein n=1 Tax=Streptacidiphilus alkalitolerans TaxID=3342712 RepID=A0ABV6X4D3_9ACTN
MVSAVLLSASLGSLPQSAHTVAQAHADAGVTVQGPAVWQPNPGDPSTGTTGPKGTVTVSQTTDLTDQVLHVSWTGFTPSANTAGALPTFISATDPNVLYPVRVYECRGLHPDVTDCYGSTLYNAKPALGFDQFPAIGTTVPEFPSNMALALTHADGTGSADIEVWTSQQSQTLGCDPTHACSLVVEPNYGGDALNYGTFFQTPGGCDDHSLDIGAAISVNEASDGVTNFQDVNGNQSGERCSWARHVTVPLSFAPTPDDCRAANSDFKVQGLEMANRAMSQWRTGACLAPSPVTVQYSAGGGEPQARAAFLGRSSNLDVALTAYPDTGPPTRPYVYAPLATSGISVAFVLDDPAGRQIRQMRLDARLLAKMLTQSYTLVPSVTSDANPAGFASVAGNPKCVFDDPEFQQLNPPDPQSGTTWPSCDDLNPLNGVAPITVGGTTDLVRQLTSWISADPDAQSFLQGAPDPWGMHVDSFYLRPAFSGYPVDALVPQDGTGTVHSSVGADKPVVFHYKQEEWNPIVGGLGQVARNTLLAQPTCYSIVFDSNGTPLNTKCPADPVGKRAVFAIMDSGQAKAFGLPEAQLENAAGAFVAPTASSMQAAVADMPVDRATGTQLLPYGKAGSAYSTDRAAYPLTTVQYAMLPTQGVPAAKADRIAAFVRQVTSLGGGQVYGPQPGQLALGFVDLTTDQQARAAAAAQHVSAQDSTLPDGRTAPASTGAPGSGSTGGSSGGSASGGTSGGGAGSGTPSPGTAGGTGAAGPSGSPLDNLQPVAAGRPNPDRAGLQRLLLPGLLVAGAVLLVGGPAALVLGGTPAGGQLRRGLGGLGTAARRGRRRLARGLGRGPGR